MELLSFTVKNFRSITNAYKIPFKDISILIGRNNEGKSNMLKALNISMSILDHHAKKVTRYGSSIYRNNDNNYHWERDFPISLQEGKDTDSIFRLEFKLNEAELNEFKSAIKSNLNGNLPIEIKIGKDNRIPTIKVVKKGKDSKPLNEKSKEIADFIGKRIKFTYIPAIRTDKESLSVVNQMLQEKLAIIEDDPKYTAALKAISELQQPIIEEVSKTIKQVLSDFLPNIKDVFIELQEERRRFGIRQQYDISIDDGSKTSLEYKGDGVKSLAAIGLLKDISKSGSAFSLIAIEEPESHLHPGAIHRLKDTIYDLSKDNQVIISTHNPLFVNRINIKNNIIIDRGQARPAKDISELRELIGVKASDNLMNANFVLVVEGEEDAIALKSLLPHFSPKIAKALKSNIMVIDKLGGASNLSYKLSLLSHSLCSFHVLLDNDDAGITAYEKAEKDSYLKSKELTLVNCRGMRQSEFEDWLNKEIYEKEILDQFRVDINVGDFRNNSKWSDRMKNVFQNQGKRWNDNIEAEVKGVVAQTVGKDPSVALNGHKASPFMAMIATIENSLDSIK